MAIIMIHTGSRGRCNLQSPDQGRSLREMPHRVRGGGHA
jgi:hypothetical protein